MAISKILYGSVPTPGTMVLFCLLLGIFAIGAPGVPGGTVMASLGIITGILKFDSSGTALMLTIFALQDSFGTACNVTGDGALTLMLTGYAKRIILRSSSLMWNCKFGAKSGGYLRSAVGYSAACSSLPVSSAFSVSAERFLYQLPLPVLLLSRLSPQQPRPACARSTPSQQPAAPVSAWKSLPSVLPDHSFWLQIPLQNQQLS